MLYYKFGPCLFFVVFKPQKLIYFIYILILSLELHSFVLRYHSLWALWTRHDAKDQTQIIVCKASTLFVLPALQTFEKKKKTFYLTYTWYQLLRCIYPALRQITSRLSPWDSLNFFHFLSHAQQRLGAIPTSVFKVAFSSVQGTMEGWDDSHVTFFLECKVIASYKCKYTSTYIIFKDIIFTKVIFFYIMYHINWQKFPRQLKLQFFHHSEPYMN